MVLQELFLRATRTAQQKCATLLLYGIIYVCFIMQGLDGANLVSMTPIELGDMPWSTAALVNAINYRPTINPKFAHSGLCGIDVTATNWTAIVGFGTLIIDDIACIENGVAVTKTIKVRVNKADSPERGYEPAATECLHLFRLGDPEILQAPPPFSDTATHTSNTGGSTGDSSSSTTTTRSSSKNRRQSRYGPPKFPTGYYLSNRHEESRASVCISEFVPGVPLVEHLTSVVRTAEELADLVVAVLELLRQLSLYGVTHRDTHELNLLVRHIPPGNTSTYTTDEEGGGGNRGAEVHQYQYQLVLIDFTWALSPHISHVITKPSKYLNWVFAHRTLGPISDVYNMGQLLRFLVNSYVPFHAPWLEPLLSTLASDETAEAIVAGHSLDLERSQRYALQLLDAHEQQERRQREGRGWEGATNESRSVGGDSQNRAGRRVEDRGSGVHTTWRRFQCFCHCDDEHSSAVDEQVFYRVHAAVSEGALNITAAVGASTLYSFALFPPSSRAETDPSFPVAIATKGNGKGVGAGKGVGEVMLQPLSADLSALDAVLSPLLGRLTQGLTLLDANPQLGGFFSLRAALQRQGQSGGEGVQKVILEDAVGIGLEVGIRDDGGACEEEECDVSGQMTFRKMLGLVGPPLSTTISTSSRCLFQNRQVVSQSPAQSPAKTVLDGVGSNAGKELYLHHTSPLPVAGGTGAGAAVALPKSTDFGVPPATDVLLVLGGTLLRAYHCPLTPTPRSLAKALGMFTSRVRKVAVLEFWGPADPAVARYLALRGQGQTLDQQERQGSGSGTFAGGGKASGNGTCASLARADHHCDTNSGSGCGCGNEAPPPMQPPRLVYTVDNLFHSPYTLQEFTSLVNTAFPYVARLGTVAGYPHRHLYVAVRKSSRIPVDGNKGGSKESVSGDRGSGGAGDGEGSGQAPARYHHVDAWLNAFWTSGTV